MAGNEKRGEADTDEPLFKAIAQTRDLVNRGFDELIERLARPEGEAPGEPIPTRLKPLDPLPAEILPVAAAAVDAPPPPRQEPEPEPKSRRPVPRPPRPATEVTVAEAVDGEAPASTRPEDTRQRLDALAKRLDERLKQAAEATDRSGET